MKSCYRAIILVLAVTLSFCLFSCEKKKQGKAVITEQELVLRQDKENSFTVDAKSKIKNVGEVDLKNVVVTGYCRSCIDLWIVGEWFVSGEIEKMPNQKDVINYITAGNEASFNFEELAFLLLKSGQKTPQLPEEIEVVIESFETVEN